MRIKSLSLQRRESALLCQQRHALQRHPKSSTTSKQNDSTPTPRTIAKAIPRKRSQVDKVADKVSLPTTWAAAGEPDKELEAMKKEGNSWNDNPCNVA